MTRLMIVLWLVLALSSATHSGFAADPFGGADPMWRLLHEPAIELELRLSPSQSQRYRTLLDGLDAKFFPLRNQPLEEGSKQAAAILAQAAKSLGSLLTRSQIRRLTEIQVRQQGTGALLQDGVVKAMHYTPDQQEQLTKVISDTLAATRHLEARVGKGEPQEPLEKQYADLKREELQTVTGILTPTQQSVWRKALGNDFDLSRLGRPMYKAPIVRHLPTNSSAGATHSCGRRSPRASARHG